MKELDNLLGKIKNKCKISLPTKSDNFLDGEFIAGQPKLFANPIPFDLVKCSLCGKQDGISQGLTPTSYYWLCLDGECLKKQLKMSQDRPKEIKANIVSLDRFDVPEELLNAKFEGSVLKPHIVSTLMAYGLKPRSFIVLSGPSGTGKTFATVATMRVYVDTKRASCQFLNVSDLYHKWREAFALGQDYLLLGKYVDKELLILDDLGVRNPTPGFHDFLYVLISKRDTNPNVGTLISTNLTSQQLLEAFGQQIWDRITRMSLRFEGTTNRTKIKHDF